MNPIFRSVCPPVGRNDNDPGQSEGIGQLHAEMEPLSVKLPGSQVSVDESTLHGASSLVAMSLSEQLPELADSHPLRRKWCTYVPTHGFEEQPDVLEL